MSSSQPFVVCRCKDLQEQFAILRLAWSKLRVTTFLLALLRLMSFGMRLWVPKRTFLGTEALSWARVTSKEFESVLITSPKNYCILNRTKDNGKALCVSHLVHTSGILPLKWFKTLYFALISFNYDFSQNQTNGFTYCVYTVYIYIYIWYILPEHMGSVTTHVHVITRTFIKPQLKWIDWRWRWI